MKMNILTTDFSLNAKKIEQYKSIEFTADVTRLREAKFHILAVAYNAFSKFTMRDMDKFYDAGEKYETIGYNYWRL